MRKSLHRAAAVCVLALASGGMANAQPGPGDWTGVYVGGTVGVAFDQTHFSLPGDANDRLLQTNSNNTAFTDCAVPDGCFVATHDSFTTFNRLKGGTTERARVRLGWAAGPNLFFVAAGYSAQETKLDLIGDCFVGSATPMVFRFSRGKTISGFNVGGGV